MSADLMNDAPVGGAEASVASSGPTAGRLLTWGKTSARAGNAADFYEKPTAHPFFLNRQIIGVSVGHGFTAVLTDDGEVYTIGSQSWFSDAAYSASQEHGTLEVQPWPQLSGRGVSKIAAGRNFVLAMTSVGLVYAWGTGINGQLGIAEEEVFQEIHPSGRVSQPTLIESLSDATQISCGDEFAAAIDVDGKVFVWGKNSSGQLGLEDAASAAAAGNGAVAGEEDVPPPPPLPTDAPAANKDQFVPRLVESLAASGQVVISVKCGSAHMAVITENKELLTAGSNFVGQCGRILGKGRDHDAALRTADLVQIGAHVTEDTLRPADEYEFVQVECLRYNTLALSSEGQLFSCGKGGNDGGGHGEHPHSLLCLIESVKDVRFKYISASSATSVAALSEDGALYIWGTVGPTQSIATPTVLIPQGVRKIYQVSCGDLHSAAIMEPLDSDALPSSASTEASSASQGAFIAAAAATSTNDEEDEEDDEAAEEPTKSEGQAEAAAAATGDAAEQSKPTEGDEDKNKAADDDDEAESPSQPSPGAATIKSPRSSASSHGYSSGSSNRLIHTGWLNKKGEKGLVKLWRKRWFALTPIALEYYEKENAPQTKKGEIALSNVMDVLPGQGDLCFNLMSKTGRFYELQAGTKQEVVQWSKAIRGVKGKQ